MSLTIPTPGDVAAATLPIDLMVWDAPNIDMTLANIIGRRPTQATRPRYDQVAHWFVGQAEDRDVQAVVFTNYAEGTAAAIRPWLEAVRLMGYDVFVKPKLDPGDDIDDDMLAHIRHVSADRRLTRLVVLSGDGRAFEDELALLATAGVNVTVVSFLEVASWARQSPLLTFVDLEEIPGAFTQPLPQRMRLEDLPPEGAWLQATGSLRAHLLKRAGEPPLVDLPAAS